MTVNLSHRNSASLRLWKLAVEEVKNGKKQLTMYSSMAIII